MGEPITKEEREAMRHEAEENPHASAGYRTDVPRLLDALEAAEAALFASARCTVEDAEREAERLRHGVPIEGDLGCPNELRATEAERERDEARAELLPCCVCGSRQPCEHDEQAEREEQKVHHG